MCIHNQTQMKAEISSEQEKHNRDDKQERVHLYKADAESTAVASQ